MIPVPFSSLFLANIVAEIGEFSHFELHSNLKANLSFLYHALMQCFFQKHLQDWQKLLNLDINFSDNRS